MCSGRCLSVLFYNMSSGLLWVLLGILFLSCLGECNSGLDFSIPCSYGSLYSLVGLSSVSLLLAVENCV